MAILTKLAYDFKIHHSYASAEERALGRFIYLGYFNPDAEDSTTSGIMPFLPSSVLHHK